MIDFSSIVSRADAVVRMSEAILQESILQFLRDRFEIELQSAGTGLVEAGILDSLMLIEIVVYIEEQFSVTTKLEDLDLDNFVTVDNMARFLATRQKSSGPNGLDRR